MVCNGYINFHFGLDRDFQLNNKNSIFSQKHIAQHCIGKSGADGMPLNFLLYLNIGISIEVRC